MYLKSLIVSHEHHRLLYFIAFCLEITIKIMADTQLAQGSNGDVAGNPPADGAAQVNMTTQLQQSFYVALIKS